MIFKGLLEGESPSLNFKVVSEYEKMKTHKVCILWSLLILSIIPYEKMYTVIKMAVF